MNAAYAQAAIPEPFRILGLRLKPFCLGHYLHLSRFQVAFVSETSAAAGLDDLVLGVLICSQTYEEFLAFIEQPDAREQLQAWGKQCAACDFAEKTSLFARYIREGSALPKFWEESTGEPGGAHWTQCVKLVLTSELGYTNAEALNLPLTQAFLDYFRFAETKGSVRLMTPDEIAQIEQHEKEAACLAK